MGNIASNAAGVSRRSFITGAAAAGVLATLGLAGCAPQDKQTADRKSVV